MVYEDGIQVEITKIKHAEVTKEDTETQDMEAKAGDPYVDFLVRVANDTRSRLMLSTSDTVAYGPDGDKAEEIYVGDAPGDISATVLPGKSKSIHIQYVIPKNYQDDVVLEFSFDFDHDTAVFSGSVK